MSEYEARQTPTVYKVLPYELSKGSVAVKLYEESDRQAFPWQKLLLEDILACDSEGLWVHPKFGYSVPRRNGKNEIVVMREVFGILNNERMLHTAHRTSTSTAASKRLGECLTRMGFVEIQRKKQGETYDHHFIYTKQVGLERITVLGAGSCDFRTRSAHGGLGEGFDTVVIDEAQEYTKDQETALNYVVTDSHNPQTIFCGTPPTAVSIGTVFKEMREDTLSGSQLYTGWAEWSIPEVTDNVDDKSLWYETNPSLGYSLKERSVESENKKDVTDFNIQRLGVWISYAQNSAISETDWEAMKLDKLQSADLQKSIYFGIKYSQKGTVALSLAVKMKNGKIFVETLDAQSDRNGTKWIIKLIENIKPKKVVVDGTTGQNLLEQDIKKIKGVKLIFPKVAEVEDAHAKFEQAIFGKNLAHMDQPSLTQSVINCEKRWIGAKGGFAYKSLKEDIDVTLLESVVFAFWACNEAKEQRVQRFSC